MRRLKLDENGSAVPLILFILTVVLCGAMYTLFFIEILYPWFIDMIPSSQTKYIIVGIFGFIPLIVAFVGVVCVIRSGMKQQQVIPGPYQRGW